MSGHIQAVDPTAEPVTPPALPRPEDLSPAEYRAFRMEGKSVEELVKAREPVVPEPAAAASQPAGPVVTPRDDQGRFAKAGEPTPLAKPNPRVDPRARIDELTKNWRTAERERDEARAEMARLRPQSPPVAPNAAATATELATTTAAKFTFRDFDAEKDASYEEYIEERAVARIKHDQALERVTQQTTQAQTAREQAATRFAERHAAFVKAHPDFDEIVQRSPVASVIPPPWIEEAMLDSEHGPALQYHLLQHPEEFHAIVSLPERAAVRALGRLEASMRAAPTGPAAPTSPKTQADPPLEPVGGSPTASTRSLESAAMAGDMRRYRELREAGVRS